MAFVYSCCFWFSLRLGGILIAIFSMFQAILMLTGFCIAYTYAREVKDQLTVWIVNMNLIYVKDYLENFRADPEKYLSGIIILTCIYIIACSAYIYGAYMFNNLLMIGFIVIELLRLITLSIMAVTWLLILKQNTMDIGLLIGASVAGGFLILGMFYLWVCASNLPVLINETEHDKQEATITTLRNLLEHNNSNILQQNIDDIPMAVSNGYTYNNGIFTAPKYNRNNITNRHIIYK